MDRYTTISLGDMVGVACLKGLKLRMAAMILFAIAGRLRMRIARQFKVASIIMGSLLVLVRSLVHHFCRHTDCDLERCQAGGPIVPMLQPRGSVAEEEGVLWVQERSMSRFVLVSADSQHAAQPAARVWSRHTLGSAIRPGVST